MESSLSPPQEKFARPVAVDGLAEQDDHRCAEAAMRRRLAGLREQAVREAHLSLPSVAEKLADIYQLATQDKQLSVAVKAVELLAKLGGHLDHRAPSAPPAPLRDPELRQYSNAELEAQIERLQQRWLETGAAAPADLPAELDIYYHDT